MRILLIALFSLTLSGCTGLGMVATETKQFSATETLQLSSRPTNFTATVAEVGQSLNYDYNGGDKAKSTVLFSDNGKFGLGSFIGQGRQLSLQVSLLPNGRTVQFEVLATANYSQASQDKITKRLNEFKTALQDRLR